jgi:hypothetical protein
MLSTLVLSIILPLRFYAADGKTKHSEHNPNLTGSQLPCEYNPTRHCRSQRLKLVRQRGWKWGQMRVHALHSVPELLPSSLRRPNYRSQQRYT